MNTHLLFCSFPEGTDRLVEGFARRIEEGKALGMAQGKAEGKAEGAEAKNREIAKMMLIDNEPIEKIMRYTGLSDTEIKELA